MEKPRPRVKLQSRVAPVAARQTKQRLQGPDNLDQGCVKMNESICSVRFRGTLLWDSEMGRLDSWQDVDGQ